MADFMYGSICLSNIPKRLFKKVKVSDGTEKVFLNISIHKRKEVGKFGHTHFVSCAPKKEEQVEGEFYICGDLKEYVPQDNQQPTTQENVNAAPPVSGDSLPF